MSVRFTSAELSRTDATMQALLSPLGSADVETWRELVVQRLASLLRADRVLFGVAMPGVEPAHRLLGAEPGDLVPYLTYFQHVDPLRTIIPQMQDGITSTTLLIPVYPGGPSRYYAGETYNDYYRPLHIEDHVSVTVEPVLEPGGGTLYGATAILTAYRSRYGTELFGDKGIAIMRLLRPALLGALEALHALACHRASLERSVDVMRDAAWLCAADGTVLHQNRAMTHLLAADAERERLQAALHAAVAFLAAASQDRPLPTDRPVRTMPADIRTRRGRYRVRGTVLETRGGTTEAAFIVALQRCRRTTDPQVLQERFGLTPRQARVALLVAERRRNREIAELLGISPHTARRHTDSVLLKLGVHSRDEVGDVIRRVVD